MTVIAGLALRRLAIRLQAPRGADAFLHRHQEAVCAAVRRSVQSAFLAVEVVLRDDTLWDLLSAHLARAPKQKLLQQIGDLRRAAGGAGLDVEASEGPVGARLAAALKSARRSGRLGGNVRLDAQEVMAQLACPDLQTDALPGDIEARALTPLGEALRQGKGEAMAQLLELRGFLGECWIVGLVDLFLCRALQADARLGVEFLFVHLERPDELWGSPLDALAELIEQDTGRVESVLDQRRKADSNGAAGGNGGDRIDRLFEEGLACYLSADYQRATVLFSAALRLDDANAALFAYRGDAYRLLCEYDHAIADYTAALKLNPNSPAVLVQRGAAYRLKGELPAVIIDCTAAIELDPARASAYSNRADAYVDMASFDEAIADYTRAIELDSASPWSYHGRGKAYLQKRACAEAIADFAEVLRLNPHHVLARLHRGDACRLQGNLAQAILDYSDVLRYHPRNALAYTSRGQAYEQQGDLGRAISDYTRALLLDPDSTVSHGRRGSLYRRTGDLDRALADLDESIRRASDNGTALYNRGLLFLTRGLHEQARAEFADALNISPGMTAAYLARALALDQLGRYAEGIQDCGRALTCDVACPAAYVIRGVIAAHAGHYPQAVADLTRALELDPHCPMIHQERGLVYLLQGNHEAAAADANRLITANPQLAMGYALRGLVRELQGNHAQAVANFARALELDPRALLAGLHQHVGDLARRQATQTLANYIEGLRPALPDPALAPPRRAPQAQRAAAIVPASETADHLPAAPADDEQTAEHAVSEPLPTNNLATARAPARNGSQTSRRPGTPSSDGASTRPAPPPKPTPRENADVTAEEPAPATAASAIPASAAGPEPDAKAMVIASREQELQTEDTAAEVLLQQETMADTSSPLPADQAATAAAVTAGSSTLPGACGVATGSAADGAVPALASSASISASASASAARLIVRQMRRDAKKPKTPPHDDDDDRVRVSPTQKLVLIACAAVLAFSLWVFFAPSFNAFVRAESNGKRVGAEDLLNTFAKAPPAIRRDLFRDDPLSVCGEVAEVIEDKRLVRFKTRLSSSSIHAIFEAPGDVHGVQQGQKIMISGVCLGTDKAGNVVLVRCKHFPYQEPSPMEGLADFSSKGSKASGVSHAERDH